MNRSPSEAILYLDRRILDWTRERDELNELLDAQPLSPERRVAILRDIAEVNRIINRLEKEKANA